MKMFNEISRREPPMNFFSQRVVIPWDAPHKKVVSSKTTLQFKTEYDKYGGGVNEVEFIPQHASHRVSGYSGKLR